MARRKQTSFARCVFVPYGHRGNLPAGSVLVDVSSYADPPWHTFSPIWTHGGIPVPGQPGSFSDTVEGIWQGLKVIRGKTAPQLFRGRGQKRGGKPSGHQYGDTLLGLVEARRKIYLPAYEWVLEKRIDPALIQLLVERACAGTTQHFHDLGANGDSNRAEPWAHASIVVQYLNRLCKQREEA